MTGNRRHSKIDDLPPEIISAINDAIVNKRKTYKEIEQWLKADGYYIHQSSIQRYGKDFLTKLEKITVAREQAKAILENSSGLKTEMAEATSTVAFQILMDILISSNDEDNKNNNNILKVISTLATLEKSTVAREKLKLEFDKGVSAALEKFKELLRNELKNHPDILEKILNIADDLKSDFKE